jgi:hypothetical protein
MVEQVVLTAIGDQDILIDNQPLKGKRTALHLGQSVRLGTSGEIIRLIACLKADDT